MKSSRPVVAVAAVVLGVFALLSSSTAAALSITQTMVAYAGLLDAEVELTLDDLDGSGDIQVTVEVFPMPRGDIRGVFLSIGDDSLLGGLSITGSDVTEVAIGASSIIDLGQGANLKGSGSPCPCDIGVEIGTFGIHPDDIQQTSFTISHDTESLTLAHFAEEIVGVRLKNVGHDECRRNSTRLQTLIPLVEPPGPIVPEPGTALLVGCGMVALGASRRRT